MKSFLLLSVISITQLFVIPLSLAQTVTIHQGSITQQMHIDETTRIFDKATGNPVSYKAYQQMMQEDRYGYHLEPIINEYGQASAYTIRPTTAEEKQTHHFNDFNVDLRPKVGQPLPEFIMKGLDDKEYRSTQLKGRVIVLSFWISLRKPFWGTRQSQAFADVLRLFQSETEPISLGILNEPREEISNVMATETLPFIPIPNSYGFHKKYQVTTGPSFMVIDRAGNVAAYVEGSNYDELRKALQAVSR